MYKYLSVYMISLGFFFLNIQRTRYVSIDIEDTKHKFITLEDEQPKKKQTTNNTPCAGNYITHKASAFPTMPSHTPLNA